MTSRKVTKASKVTEVATDAPSTAPANAGTNPVPAVAKPPTSWVPTAKIGKKGRRPKKGLSIAAPGLVAELRKNPSGLSQELGPKAVAPQQLADALDLANSWDKADDDSSNFHTYVRSERNASWDAALALMAGMKAGVRFAVSRDASFADRFPGVAKAFAPTRRSKKAAAATTGTPSPATTSRKTSATAATEPASPATPAAAAPAAAPDAASSESAPTA